VSQLVQPTRILIVGGGAREHALAWKLAAEPGVNEVVVAPGSDAIALEPRVRREAAVDPLDPAAVVEIARRRSVELAVIGPEGPLAAGVSDALAAAGVAVFGPTAAAARIETSKAFCHDVAAVVGVPMARAATFTPGERDAAIDWAGAELGRPGSSGVVVKADGLASGKGVTVCDTLDVAVEAIRSLARSGGALVLEERLAGREASVIAVTDGRIALALPSARDHKRLLDGDGGPNTGGMGAYSPVPELDDAAVDDIVATIHRPILAELAARGAPFRGFLYAGLILTSDGPRLLECNARLGDPEAQVILPRLAGPLAPTLLAAAQGRLPGGQTTLPTMPGAAVGVVLAAGDYPAGVDRGSPIAGLAELRSGPTLTFHAATVAGSDGGWSTNGGRVLTVVGRGPTLADARQRAEAAADAIAWRGMQRRRDIAAAELMAATR
jgi:phosphoribosylamine--glycine ligase